MEDIDLWLAINDQNIAKVNRPELDFFEYFNPSNGYAMALHDWTNNINSVEATHNIERASVGPADFSKMNTFGILWIPQSQSGDTGLVRRYFNGKHIATADVTYSSTAISPQASKGFPGVFSDLDTSTGYVLQIGSGHGWAIHVDYVRVWQ